MELLPNFQKLTPPPECVEALAPLVYACAQAAALKGKGMFGFTNRSGRYRENPDICKTDKKLDATCVATAYQDLTPSKKVLLSILCCISSHLCFADIPFSLPSATTATTKLGDVKRLDASGSASLHDSCGFCSMDEGGVCSCRRRT